jgi:hypothetical protein
LSINTSACPRSTTPSSPEWTSASIEQYHGTAGPTPTQDSRYVPSAEIARAPLGREARVVTFRGTRALRAGQRCSAHGRQECSKAARIAAPGAQAPDQVQDDGDQQPRGVLQVRLKPDCQPRVMRPALLRADGRTQPRASPYSAACRRRGQPRTATRGVRARAAHSSLPTQPARLPRTTALPMRLRRAWPRRVCCFPWCAEQVSGCADGVAAGCAGLHHLDSAPLPGARQLDRSARTFVAGLRLLEKSAARAPRNPPSSHDAVH